MSSFDQTFLSFVIIGFILYVIKFIKEKNSRDQDLLKRIDYLVLLLEKNNQEK